MEMRPESLEYHTQPVHGWLEVPPRSEHDMPPISELRCAEWDASVKRRTRLLCAAVVTTVNHHQNVRV